MAAVVSLPSLAVSAIPSLPSPGAVGALPDATVSLSTPMERAQGGRDAQPTVNIIHSLYKVRGCSGIWGSEKGVWGDGGSLGKIQLHFFTVKLKQTGGSGVLFSVGVTGGDE